MTIIIYYLLIGAIIHFGYWLYSMSSSHFSWFDVIALTILVPIWPVIAAGLIWQLYNEKRGRY